MKFLAIALSIALAAPAFAQVAPLTTDMAALQAAPTQVRIIGSDRSLAPDKTVHGLNREDRQMSAEAAARAEAIFARLRAESRGDE